MFKSKIFTTWFVTALAIWALLFSHLDTVQFWLAHWYYAAMMVGGAFVAGFTPAGGGAVAFPVLNLFLHVDRTVARDFSMMIQSIGMTSASIFILTEVGGARRAYRPLWTLVPICFLGFLLGMILLQQMQAYLVQALFVCLTTTFVIAYFFCRYRGDEARLIVGSTADWAYLVTVLIIGGMITSLFGTGADIVLYMLLVTRFGVAAKIATRISIILQASMSILGYGYRAFVDHGLTEYQIKTWLCAYPVVLFMAPFGAYALSKLHLDSMLKFIIAVSVFQLLYFNLHDPSPQKLAASAVFTIALSVVFFSALRHLSRKVESADGKGRQVSANIA